MLTSAIDLITFLQSNFSFLFALAIYTTLAVVLSNSIKKNYKVYYWVFGLLSAGFIIPSICRLCGITLPFNFGQIPILGPCFSELSSAANFIHPVIIIIMYMGAFSPKVPIIGKLMSIRKELSIIVGFPVLAHAIKRLFGSFVQGWQYFFDHETYMASPRVSSALGSGITSFVFVLGLFMTILFLVLWITSFDSVHRKMGTQKWKKVQKWSYGLYAMLFIHSMGLQLGGIISDNARTAQQAQQPRTEMVAEQSQQRSPRGEMSSEHSHSQQGERSQQGEQQAQQAQPQQAQPQQAQPQAQQSGGHSHGPQAFLFANNIEIDRNTKRKIHIVVLLLIYGSYLYFRLRKSREDRAKREAAKGKAAAKK
ncbi:MAG: hypothetical protein SNH63_05840 [Rikenellaceae bacterium]